MGSPLSHVFTACSVISLHSSSLSRTPLLQVQFEGRTVKHSQAGLVPLQRACLRPFRAFNPSTQKVEAGGLWAWGQPGLHTETLSLKDTLKNKQNWRGAHFNLSAGEVETWDLRGSLQACLTWASSRQNERPCLNRNHADLWRPQVHAPTGMCKHTFSWFPTFYRINLSEY